MAKLPASSLEAGFGKYRPFMKIPAFRTKCPQYVMVPPPVALKRHLPVTLTHRELHRDTYTYKLGCLFCAPALQSNIILLLLSTIAWSYNCSPKSPFLPQPIIYLYNYLLWGCFNHTLQQNEFYYTGQASSSFQSPLPLSFFFFHLFFFSKGMKPFTI